MNMRNLYPCGRISRRCFLHQAGGGFLGVALGGLWAEAGEIPDARLGPQWTEAVVFGYLIMIMVLRPRGLLGEETREAG